MGSMDNWLKNWLTYSPSKSSFFLGKFTNFSMLSPLLITSFTSATFTTLKLAYRSRAHMLACQKLLTCCATKYFLHFFIQINAG